jgi:hypothetical protein
MPICETGVVQGHTECEPTDCRSWMHSEPLALVDGGPQGSAEDRQEAFRLHGHQHGVDALEAEEREGF